MTGERKLRQVIELTGEQKYRQAMKNIETSLKGVSSQQALVNSQYAKGDQSTAALTKRADVLRAKLDEQKKRLELVRAEYERVSKAQGEGSDRAKALARDLNYEQAAVNKTETELKAMTSAIEKANSRVDIFKSRLKESGVTLDAFGKSLTSAGDKYTRFVTAAVAGGATVATKLFMDYDDALAALSTLPDAAAYGVDKLSGQILEASDVTGAAATELTSATYDAISSGAAVADAVGMVEGAAKAAKAGMSDTGTVIKGAAAAINAFGLATADSTDVYNKFLVAQDAGVLTVNDIASNIGQVTGLAGPLNVKLEEVLASTAALTKIGVPVSSAFTQIKAVMAGVLKPTAEATKEAKRLGIEFDAAALKSKGLTGFLADIAAKTAGSEESLAKLFGSVEGLSAVMALGTTAAQDYNDILAQLGNSAGTLDAKFGARIASSAQQLSMEVNKLKNNAIQLGATFAPVLAGISGSIEGLNGFLRSMNDEQRQAVVQAALWVAAIGPMLIGVGKLITAIGTIKKSLTALGTLIGAGTGPLGIALVSIAAVTAGVIALKNHIDSLRPENKIKASFAMSKIDQTAIDKAIQESEGVTHDLDVLVNAKVKLTNDSTDLYNEIVQWLSDGKAETEAQQQEYEKKAGELVQPVYDAIQTAFNEKKAALDAQLAGGILDTETYNARLGELTAATDAAKTSLSAEGTEFVNYVATLVDANAVPTEAQFAKLEELRQKVVDVGAELLQAQNIALQAARASVNLVGAGKGTEKDIATGVKYLQTDTALKTSSIEADRNQQLADLQSKVDAANAAGRPLLAGYFTSLQDQVNQEYEAKKQEILDDYTRNLNDMMNGMEAKYPEEVAKLKDVAEKQNLYEQIAQALTDVGSEDPEIAQAGQDMLNQIYGQLNDTDAVPLNNAWALGAADDLKNQINNTINGTDFGGVFTDLSAAIDAGALDNLDLTGVSGALSAALTALDLKDDGKTIGEQLVLGEIESIDANDARLIRQFFALGGDSIQGQIDGAESKRKALIAKYAELARAGLAAARQALDSRSPSRKFMRLGEDSGEGMVIGLNRKIAKVQSTMRSMVAVPQAGSAQPSASAPTNAPSISNHVSVNYTGAISEREARKLNRLIGKTQKLAMEGKGKW